LTNIVATLARSCACSAAVRTASRWTALIVPGLPDPAALRALGARRLSAGPTLGLAAAAGTRAAAAALLERGDYRALLEHGLAYPEVNGGFARG
jgi:hypothetical protein